MKMFLVVWMFFLMSTVRMTTELPSTVKKTRVKGTVPARLDLHERGTIG